MKIGTLTLHLPFNYGNALQMLSLHRYLVEQGYDAEVLGHWYFKNRDEVLFLHNKIRTLKGLLHVVFDCLTFGGIIWQFVREAKLDKWLKRHIRWSDERGATDEFRPERIPHDIVIVGSDQIWNPVHRTSEFFLLPTFPERIKKIAYAASLGTDSFIESRKPFFAANMKRFSAISVRESSAVAILKAELGVDATLVCDPTLLHTREEWCSLLGITPARKSTDDIVMYLVTPDYRNKWRQIAQVARQSGVRVHFYAFQWSQWLPAFDVHHPLQALRLAGSNLFKRIYMFFSGVRLHLTATPAEFVKQIADSDGLITDSFHGMMFATIFDKKCNVVVGEHEERLQMSARLKNFADNFGRPEIITSTFSLKAMKPLHITDRLAALVVRSKKWLMDAIEIEGI